MPENLKTEKKSLFELGEEYEKHIELQNSFIENCKKQIKKAEESGDFRAVEKFRSELNKFYEIRRELQETASKLKNYYGGKNNESKNYNN